MCGFSGLVLTEPIQPIHSIQADQSIHAIQHRGPDYLGTYVGEYAVLKHARLAIQDLDARSNQPFQISGQPHILAFNGEIYNHLEIRKKLESKGIIFQTTGDTETVYRALQTWGVESISQFEGFFAIAWWNPHTRECWLIRDRMGVKPLLYSKLNNGICFSSELSGILPFIPNKAIDLEALQLYFQYSYVPAPYSMIEGVSKLMPGEIVQFSEGKIKSEYWYRFPANHGSVNSTQIQTLLENAVEDQLLSDVAVGTFLSGGIDSTILTSISAKRYPQLQAFSVSFPDTPFLDESHLAKETAKQLGIQHHILEISQADFLQSARDAMQSLSEPFADSSAIPVYALSKFAAQHVKVILSGDGADELFGGYNKYYGYAQLTKWQAFSPLAKAILPMLNAFPNSREHKFSNLNRKLQKFCKLIALKPEEAYTALTQWQTPVIVNNLLLHKPTASKRIYRHLNIQANSISSVLEADLQFVLPNDMLWKADSMSMAHGLELRVPFLHNTLTNTVRYQQNAFYIEGNNKKAGLKSAMRDYIPNHILNSPKRGFEVPLETWMRSSLKSELEIYTDENYIKSQNIFNSNYILEILSNSNQNQFNFQLMYAYLVFQIWYTKHFQQI